MHAMHCWHRRLDTTIRPLRMAVLHILMNEGASVFAALSAMRRRPVSQILMRLYYCIRYSNSDHANLWQFKFDQLWICTHYFIYIKLISCCEHVYDIWHREKFIYFIFSNLNYFSFLLYWIEFLKENSFPLVDLILEKFKITMADLAL